MRKTGLIRKIVYYTWLGIIVCFGFLFLFRNEYFQPEFLYEFINRYDRGIWALYVAMILIRGFFLIPSTPFVLAGIMLFPDQPFAVVAVSMTGVVFSATLLYFYSDNIGFSDYLKKRYPEKMEWVKTKLSGKYQFPLIFGWAVFPPVPTDLICYVSGIIGIKYWIMLVGVFLGKLILVSTYVFLGHEFLEWLHFI